MIFNYLILKYIFLLIVVVLIVVILLYFLNDSSQYSEKINAYECGFQIFNIFYQSFDIQFYHIGMLFLIFDLEILLIFPWLINFFYFPVFINLVLIIISFFLLSIFIYENSLAIFDNYSKKF